MDNNKLFLELVSPERGYVSTEVDEVYAPGAEGDMGILPGHAALVSALREGEFRYRIGSETEYVAVDGGFMEVLDNKVTVLADGAELGRDLNLDELLRRKMETEQELEEARRKDNFDFSALEAKLRKELVRISVAKNYTA
jgi:F-type H+-transporting ATPase subunit epsilon